MGATKVVARYTDGKVIRGFTQDFYPNKDRFHLILDDNRRTVEVPVPRLKAVFFVRDFSGDPQYQERKRYLQGENPGGGEAGGDLCRRRSACRVNPARLRPETARFFCDPRRPREQ